MFNSNEIKMIPDIDEQIIKAIDTKQLILFIGAGVSSIAGLPLWSDLSYRLIIKCRNKGYIDAQECDLLLTKVSDSKKRITIAHEIFRSNNNESEFNLMLSQELTISEANDAGKTIFEFCQKSNALILTTNADVLLDSYFQPKLVFSDIENDRWPLIGPGLVKIHGTIDKPETLVFTTEQYLKRYSNSKFKSYLEEIFRSEKTILFLGYGLSEFELLEYMLSPIEQNNKRRNIFVLNPYFSYEEAYKKNMDLYYDSINIKQIAYSRDKNDYHQLSYLVEEWQKKIERHTEVCSNRLAIINQCLLETNDIKSNIPMILQVTSESEQTEDYFFKMLSSSPNKILWLQHIEKTALFNPKIKIKPAVSEIDETGKAVLRSFSWSGLLFIDSLLHQRNCDKTIYEIAGRILITSVKEIIKDVTKASNYHIIHVITSLLPLFNQNICGEDLYTFLDILSNEPSNALGRFAFSLCRKDSQFAFWDDCDIRVVFEKIFDKIEKIEKSNELYYYEKFVQKYNDFICQKYPEFIFKKSLEWIIANENKNKFSFYHIGAVAISPDENDYTETNVKIVFNLFKQSLKYIGSDSVTFLFSDDRANQFSILKKIQIFIISEHFEPLKEKLFSLESNPFEDWDLYADLYYLIKKNNELLTHEECQKLFDWITESDYGFSEKQAEYIKVIKYDFIKLLAKHHPEFSDNVELFYSEQYNKYPPIYERNKKIRFSSSWESDTQKYVDEMSNKTFSEIVQYLIDSKPRNEYNLRELQSALRQTLTNDEELIYENLDLFEELPYEYYSSIVSVIRDKKNYSKAEKTFDIFNRIINLIPLESSKLSILYDIYSAIEKLIFDKDQKAILLPHAINFLFQSLKITEEYFMHTFDDNENHASSDITFKIYNTWYCSGLGLLLRCVAICKDASIKEKTVSFVSEILLKETTKNELICATLAMHLKSIYRIDKAWATNNLKHILISYDCLIALVHGNFMPKEVYYAIKPKGFVEETIFRYVKSPNKDVYRILVFWLINISLQYKKISDYVFPKILNHLSSSLLYCMFYSISECYENDKNIKSANETLLKTCEEIQRKQLNLENNHDQAIRYFAKCLWYMETVNSVFWECFEKLSIGFNDFLSEEVCNAFSKHFERYPEQIAKIVCSMIEHSKEYAFSFDMEFDEIIRKILKTPDLSEYSKRIRNLMIERKIYRFLPDTDAEL